MRIRTLVLLSLCLIAGLLFSGCGDRSSSSPPEAEAETTEAPEDTSPEPVEAAEEPQAGGTEEEIVATVNGRPAYRDDLESARLSLLNQYVRMYAQFGMSIESLLAGPEGRLFQLSLETEALHQVLATLLVEEEADRRGIQPTADEVEAEFDSQYALFLASQEWTEDDLVAYLEEQGSTLEGFMENATETVEWQLTLDAVRRAVTGPVDPSDEEMATYFEEHRADYATEEQVRASHILFGTSDDDLLAYLEQHTEAYGAGEDAPELEEVRDELVADIRKEAEQVLAELEAGADFAALAMEHSTGPTGPDGGDLGWFGRGRMVEPFEEAAFSLEVGEISDLVETQYGFHIILLTDHKDAFDPELSQVADQVRSDVEEEQLNEGLQAWYEGAQESAEYDILLPLVDAMWAQQEDIDLGIAAFERIRDEGTVDEPYLPYFIASLYETKLHDAEAEKAALESEEGETPERDAQIEALDARIVEYRERALAEYRLALENVGSNATIEAKISELAPEPEEPDAAPADAPTGEESPD